MPALLSKTLLLMSIVGGILTLSGCQSDANAESPSGDKSAAAKKSADVPEALRKKITEKFAAARSDLKVIDVVSTGATGVYQVFFDGKGAVYAVDGGDYFFVGDLYQIDNKRIVNVTEQESNGPRAELMASIKRDDMIVFTPEGKVKASVVVFTDVDCGYCRKLHDEVPKMNELGIEVKYLAYPRAGINSDSYKRIASAWCADDPRDAITKLKSGQNIPINVCEGNPVANQFNAGIRAGLNGTPAIVLESGELIPGYMPAEKLAKTLGI